LTQNIKFTNNTCRFNRNNQLEIWQVINAEVMGNRTEESAASGNMSSICVYQSDDITVTSNKILNAYNNGIGVWIGSNRVTIGLNQIRETNLSNNASATGGNGVMLGTNGGAPPTNVTVQGNDLESVNANTLTKCGVFSDVEFDCGNLIENNNIRSYGAADVHFQAYATCHLYTWGVPAPPVAGPYYQGNILKTCNWLANAYAAWMCITGGILCTTAWAASTTYTVGTQVYSGANVYTCTTAGKSGTVAISGTSTSITDNLAKWTYSSTLAVFKGFGMTSA
jgi:hypothetical protein